MAVCTKVDLPKLCTFNTSDYNTMDHGFEQLYSHFPCSCFFTYSAIKATTIRPSTTPGSHILLWSKDTLMNTVNPVVYKEEGNRNISGKSLSRGLLLPLTNYVISRFACPQSLFKIFLFHYLVCDDQCSLIAFKSYDVLIGRTHCVHRNFKT